MNAFPIGLSALSAGRRALDLIGQNIANAATPGYHRQTVNLASQSVDGLFGVGVGVASITRNTAPPVRTAMLRGNTDQAAAAARLDVRRQVETMLGAGGNGVGGQIERFFNQAEQLTARPDDLALRRTFLASASDLAARFNTTAGDLDRLRKDVGGQITQVVAEVNDLADRVAKLNARIEGIERLGGQANDLRDLRDGLIDQLSQRIDVRTVEQPFGVVNVVATSAVVVAGEFANAFAAGTDPNGSIAITQAGSAQPLGFASGRLGGLLREYNQDLPATRARLDALATEFVARVNHVQATGVGASGPLTQAAGTRSVADPAASIATQVVPLPTQPGQIVVSVTDTATGQRVNVTVSVDPTTQSLAAVAAAISAATGGRVLGSVDPATNSLRLQAASGFAFDFAGRMPNPPDGSTPIDNPDTSGVLAALGVTGLFTGTDAASIRVNPDVVADPGRIAAGRTGGAGDGRNLERLAALRDQPVIGGRTFAAEAADMAAAVGSVVRQLDDQQAAQAGILRTLSAQEQAVGGVDVNEELVNLLDFQRMITAASQYMSAVNTALDSLLGIVR